MRKLIEFLNANSLINLSALARETHINRQALNDVLKGKKAFPVHWVWPICKALARKNVMLDDLVFIYMGDTPYKDNSFIVLRVELKGESVKCKPFDAYTSEELVKIIDDV